MAKVDLESGIAKSLCGAPLNVEEIMELKDKGIPTLIVEHELDSIMAEVVVNHVRKEAQRVIYQDQMTRKKIQESVRGSYKKILSKRANDRSSFSLEDITDV